MVVFMVVAYVLIVKLLISINVEAGKYRRW